jgi:hypothetical protein
MGRNPRQGRSRGARTSFDGYGFSIFNLLGSVEYEKVTVEDEVETERLGLASGRAAGVADQPRIAEAGTVATDRMNPRKCGNIGNTLMLAIYLGTHSKMMEGMENSETGVSPYSYTIVEGIVGGIMAVSSLKGAACESAVPMAPRRTRCGQCPAASP